MIGRLRDLVLSDRYNRGAFDRFLQAAGGAAAGEQGRGARGGAGGGAIGAHFGGAGRDGTSAGRDGAGFGRDGAGAGDIRAEWSLSSGSYGSELYEFFTNGMSSAGVALTERTAMMVSSVYACVSIIAGAITTLPAHIYRRDDEGGSPERVQSADIWWLLNEQAAPAWTASAFWQYLIWSRLLQGDAFARIRRNRARTRIVGFEPLHPFCVEPLRLDDDAAAGFDDPRSAASLVYRVQREDGTSEMVDQGDMIHVTGPGFDGLRSMSTIRYALRHPGGVALAADEYSARFFENGARPDFALEWPGKLDDQAKALLRETWTSTFGGPRNSHLPAVMTQGAKIVPLDMKAEDAQLIETRRFQVEDVCRIFGVPPHMVGATEKASSWGSGIEQLSIGFVKYTLSRHLVALEQEFNRKLWRTGPLFMEFLTAGLERGDFKARQQGYRSALGRAGEDAWMTVNEVRRLENMPPVDGGDELRRADAAAAAEPAPAPAEEAEPTETEKALALMAGSVAVIAAREPAPAQVTVTPAPVSVTVGEVIVEGAVTHVAPAAAPAVHVDAPVHVDVPEPKVVIKHPRRAIQTIQRDPESKEMKQTVTTFED